MEGLDLPPSGQAPTCRESSGSQLRPSAAYRTWRERPDLSV